ncbi:MAG: AsmA-like C-terminal domain-containing protein [Deltaproteobacteria bacterium]|nr:AsmA-like C-terminal domain-containing protein [Deltaproteobacteria bacterium]
MTFRTLRRIILALFLAVLCSGTGLFLMMRNPSVQRYGLTRISREIGYDLNAGSMGLSLGIKPGIRVQDIQVSTKQGKVLLSASVLTLTPHLSDLFLSGAGTFFSGSVEARNLRFQLDESGGIKDYALPQVVFQGKYDLNKRLLQIASLKIITPETSLSATGHVQLSPTASPYLDLSVSSPFMTVDTLKSLLPALLLPEWIDRELLSVIKKGDIRMDTVSLKGDLEQIKTLDQLEHAKVLGLNLTLRNLVMQRPDGNTPELRDVFCALSIKDGALSLDGLSGRLLQSAFQNSSVDIPNIYADRMHYLTKTEASLSLSDVNHLKNLSFFPADVQQEIRALQEIDGTADIRASIEYETGQPFPKIITSAISLQSIKVAHPLLRLPLILETAAIDSEPDQPMQFSGRGSWGKSEFQVQGTADSTCEHVSARATTRADVREVIELGLPHAVIGDWIYGPLDAEGLLSNGCAILDSARIDMGKGYLRFKGRQANLGFGRLAPEMHWIGHIHLVQERAQNLIQLIHPGADLLDGSVSVEGVLTLKNSDGTGAFSGLDGHATLVVEKGWIRQNNVILNALALISLENIFKPGTSGVQDGRLYFDRIEGDIEIEKGKILVQNLTLKSPAINVAGAGTIDLNRDHLQLRIGLEPLGMADKLVSSIPVIGNILTGKEKSLIVYSLDVTGSLSNPQIKNVPMKNLGESALGYLERLVYTPERIMKSLKSLKGPARPVFPDYHAEFDRMAPGPCPPSPIISVPR